MSTSKRLKSLIEKVDRDKLYPALDGLNLVKETAKAKFDESIDAAINLGIDAKKSDQAVRGALVLPNGTGKTTRVAVFAQGDAAEAAKKAGADIVQIFDSWAGLIPPNKLFDYCYEPNRKIVDFCKKKKIPVICFPRGINKNYLEFANIVKPDCLSLDYEINPTWAINNLSNYCLQGGLDPKALFKNENEMNSEVDKYLNIFKGHPYIFNLGHGLLPETSPEVLQKVVERVNNFK